MANVEALTDQSFQATLNADETPVLVDFSATWCQPCKALAVTIDAMAKEHEGRLRVYKVDVDQANETAAKFGVSGVPTCVFFKGGKEVDRFMGNKDMRSVRQHIETVLA